MVKEYNQNQVEQIFLENRCHLLDTYVSYKLPVKYKCECNNISKISLRSLEAGIRCKICARKKSAAKQKHSLTYVKEFFSNRNCTLLSEDYKNNNSLLEFICECGNQSKIRFMHFRKGIRCGCKNKGNNYKHGQSKNPTQYYLYRCSLDPSYKLRNSVSHSIRMELKGRKSKKDKSIFSILPYTLKELKTNLESKWENWMSWDNYGGKANDERKTWWIDHIKPQSSFDFTNMNDDSFIECWSLSNLRPMEK